MWAVDLEVPGGIVGGTSLHIAATASGTVLSAGTGGHLPNPGPDPEPEPTEEPFTREIGVDVVLDRSVPDVLTFDPFPSVVDTERGVPHVRDFSGNAGDRSSGISAVRFRVDGGPFADVSELTDSGDGLKAWRRKDVALVAGDHTLSVQALDGLGNHREVTAVIRVHEPVEPGLADQVFAPTRYLHDLVDFAHRYLDVAGVPGTVTSAVLAARFGQPFDRLVEPARFQQAVAPVSQTRIAVEVLRGQVASTVPPEVEQRFRGLAHRSFLRSLGTSYEELRDTRTAGDPARVALADRLGVGMTGTRPDRLDQLTTPPDRITDDALETLSGYRSTAGDPLRPATEAALVMLWRRDALRSRWRQEDEAARDSAAGPRPVLDPDLVGQANLRNPRPTDPAFALWTQRTAAISAGLAEIRHDLGAGGPQLSRFDQAVARHVGTIDLPALAAQDAAGADITSPLAAFELALEAFRFMARCRGLLVDGVELGAELEDVAAILVQAQKRGQFRTWRREERQAGLVLEPASFQPDPPSAETDPASRWRRGAAEYADWRRTLAGRISAADGIESGYVKVLQGGRGDHAAQTA